MVSEVDGFGTSLPGDETEKTINRRSCWTNSSIWWTGSPDLGGPDPQDPEILWIRWGLTRPLLILTRARGREKTMRTTPCVQKVSEKPPPPDMAKTPPQAQNHVGFRVDFGRARNMQNKKNSVQKNKK